MSGRFFDAIIKSHPAYPVAVRHVARIIPATLTDEVVDVAILREMMAIAFIIGVQWAGERRPVRSVTDSIDVGPISARAKRDEA